MGREEFIGVVTTGLEEEAAVWDGEESDEAGLVLPALSSTPISIGIDCFKVETYLEQKLSQSSWTFSSSSK